MVATDPLPDRSSALAGGVATADGAALADGVDAAVRAMLGARSIAVVGASDRPGSFGQRLVTETLRSDPSIAVHLVNPRAGVIEGRPVVPSLDVIDGPVDLVLVGVADAAATGVMQTAADRGDHSAVVYGSLFDPADPTSMAHEMGHRMEDRNPEISVATNVFLARRTAGLAPQRYARNELVVEDSFAHAYIGKNYPGHHTELFSCGIEAIAHGQFGGLQGRAPVELAALAGYRPARAVTPRADPEHLALVLGLLASANKTLR